MCRLGYTVHVSRLNDAYAMHLGSSTADSELENFLPFRIQNIAVFSSTVQYSCPQHASGSPMASILSLNVAPSWLTAHYCTYSKEAQHHCQPQDCIGWFLLLRRAIKSLACHAASTSRLVPMLLVLIGCSKALSRHFGCPPLSESVP